MTTRSAQLDRSRFFGRQELLDRLQELAGKGARVSLTGPSGCGKSRLAREFASRESGAFYIDLSTASSVEDAEAAMSAVAWEHATMVLFEGPVWDLTDRARATTTLCSCDGSWAAEDVQALEVGPLGPDDAQALLVDRVRAGDAEFRVDDSNHDSVDELLSLSGGWPLVIEQLARRLTLFTPAELVDQCRNGAVPWQGLPGTKAWSAEFDRFDADEWQVFGAALALPGGFDLSLMGEVVGLAASELLDAIEGLSDALVIRRVDARGSSASRFVVDQSAHAAASARREQREVGFERVRAFWVDAAERLWETTARGDGPDLTQMFRHEERNAVHVFERLRRKHPIEAARVGAALFHCCRTGWSVERQEQWAQDLDRLRADAGDLPALLIARANWLRATRRFDEAAELFDDIASGGTDSADIALQLEQARCLNLADRFDEAFAKFEEVLDRAPSAYRAFRADAHLGAALKLSGELNLDEARDHLTQALALSREIRSPITLERTRQTQISVAMAQGDYETARLNAAAILTELGDDADPRRIAGGELQLADVLVEMNDTDGAIACVERATDILESYEFSSLRGYAGFVLAKVALVQGDADAAISHIAGAHEWFGSEPAAFLLDFIGEVARSLRDPALTRPEAQDEVAEAAWAYWTPVGATAELLFLACRKAAGMWRAEDNERLQRVVDLATESGMHSRLGAARMLQGEEPEHRGFDGLVIARLMQRSQGPALTVGPGGRWFKVAGEDRVDIAGRKALPELLDAIVEAGGESLDPYELAGAGWPDEELHPDTAKNRVYVAVHALRKMGLAEMLRTEGGGYALEHGVTVHRSE